MATFLCCPSVWRDHFSLPRVPFDFVLLACTGGSRYADGARVQLGGGGWGQLLPSQGEKLISRSLHIIASRDPGRGDAESVYSWFDSSSAKLFEPDCGHEIPMPLRRDEALHAQIKNFLTGS